MIIENVEWLENFLAHQIPAIASAAMRFINGTPVMKIFNLSAKSYRDYAGTVSEYNAFWKRRTRQQAYTFGVFLALGESGILFSMSPGLPVFYKTNFPFLCFCSP